MNLDPHYDVVIVGAGPCGANAARYAAEDASALQIEKKNVVAFLCSAQASSRCTTNMGN